MTIPESVQPFWDQFQASIDYDASPRFYEAFHFDDHEAAANTLVELVLSGQKRATAALVWGNEHSGKPLPTVGALSIVTDWQGTPRCIIETTAVEIVPYDHVSEQFAATEGEGDKSLAHWRDVHWRYFSRECQRIGREPTLLMPIVCEQFKMIYPG